MAIPSRVVSIAGETATVDTAGVRREVSLMLIDEPPAVGDYVLVQNGFFAYERLSEAQALQSLALIDDLVATHDGADLRAW